MTPYHTDTFFTIKSKELYEKMQYEYKKLLEDMFPYNIFNFFVTAYHLKDYIKVEYDLNETNDIRTFKNMDELLNISGFIANKGILLMPDLDKKFVLVSIMFIEQLYSSKLFSLLNHFI
jgi:hypothetical protein